MNEIVLLSTRPMHGFLDCLAYGQRFYSIQRDDRCKAEWPQSMEKKEGTSLNINLSNDQPYWTGLWMNPYRSLKSVTRNQNMVWISWRMFCLNLLKNRTTNHQKVDFFKICALMESTLKPQMLQIGSVAVGCSGLAEECVRKNFSLSDLDRFGLPWLSSLMMALFGSKSIWWTVGATTLSTKCITTMISHCVGPLWLLSLHNMFFPSDWVCCSGNSSWLCWVPHL